MQTRREVKLKKQDAYDLCNDLYAGNCTCARNGINPCSAWVGVLRMANHVKMTPFRYETDRMRRGERY